MSSLDVRRAWVVAGNAILDQVMSAASDGDLREPSLLPDWTRAHVLSHVANNAVALGNLLTWAHTGIEQAMYVSMEQRNADVETGARLSAADLRAGVRSAAADFESRANLLDEPQWHTEVRNFRGQPLRADSVPWLRAREVFIHTVDLGLGVGFDDLPTDFLLALVGEIAEQRSGGEGVPALVLQAEGWEWDVRGSGVPVVVRGSLGDAASYLLGRSPAEITAEGDAVPPMPRWF